MVDTLPDFPDKDSKSDPVDDVNVIGFGDAGGEIASYSGGAADNLKLVVNCEEGVADGTEAGAGLKLKFRATFGGDSDRLDSTGVATETCLGGVGVASLSRDASLELGT